MFALLWSPSAVERLESILLNAQDPEAIIEAVLEIDRMLSRDPEENSESRAGTQRVAFARPLGVLFSIVRATRTVEIVDVWTIRPS
jgi:hypothetical protein